MARRIKRDAWRRLAAKTTLPQQLDALEMIHKNLMDEVQTHGRKSAEFYRSAYAELGRLGEALIAARKRQIMERDNDGDGN